MLVNWLPMIFVLGALILAGVLVIRKFAIPGSDSETAVGTFVAPTVLSLYLIATAMGLVIGWENNNGARDLALEEATAATRLYWTTGSLPAEQGEPIREDLRSYVTSVIEEDWPLMAEGELSQAGESKLAQLRAHVAQLPSDDYELAGERMLAHQQAAQLVADRLERDDAAGANLPVLLIAAAAAAAAAVVVLPFALKGRRSRATLMWSLVNLAFVCSSVLTLVMLDNPYSGIFAVSAEPFENALAGFDEIDQMLTGV
ncbi:bestrophin-like domain [Salinactinospora qingdaonensis]|uniref:DUF4239 domain-containing protein n=1 Tax=Salinactinospora qingdaonensis TaxID=702744 RepID=A0ABP7GDN6_9ACTN